MRILLRFGLLSGSALIFGAAFGKEYGFACGAILFCVDTWVMEMKR